MLVELYTDGTDAARKRMPSWRTPSSPACPRRYSFCSTSNENVLATSGYTRDTQEFLAFLKTRSKA